MQNNRTYAHNTHAIYFPKLYWGVPATFAPLPQTGGQFVHLPESRRVHVASALSRTLSRARNITVATVIAGKVKPIRTTVEQPWQLASVRLHTQVALMEIIIIIKSPGGRAPPSHEADF